MADLVRLSAVLGKSDPAIWDATVRRGLAVFQGVSKDDLNPEPVPPKRELPARVGGDGARHRFRHGLCEAAGKEGASRILTRVVDDWCGTRPPRIPIPWPGPWLFPSSPEPEPHPDRKVGASRVVGAPRRAFVGSRLSGGETRDAVQGRRTTAGSRLHGVILRRVRAVAHSRTPRDAQRGARDGRTVESYQ
jgi:hypothetical protein